GGVRSHRRRAAVELCIGSRFEVLGGERPAAAPMAASLREVLAADASRVGLRLVGGEMCQEAAIPQRGSVAIHDEEAPAGSSLYEDFARAGARVGITREQAALSN